MAAAISSGARMRPSLSVSIRASVFGVELQPGGGAGQRDPELLVELVEVRQVGPESSLTWSKPPARKKRQRYGAAAEFVISLAPLSIVGFRGEVSDADPETQAASSGANLPAPEPASVKVAPR